jgi:hypothetical protein
VAATFDLDARRSAQTDPSTIAESISSPTRSATIPHPHAKPDELAPARPLLIYDGDCAFCVYWARYWEKLTGDGVIYRPYQEITAQHPEIPLAEFRRAAQYIGSDGGRASAAEASFSS